METELFLKFSPKPSPPFYMSTLHKFLLKRNLKFSTFVHHQKELSAEDFSHGKRIFKPKQMYDPKDLNDQQVELSKKKMTNRPKTDLFEQTRLDPLKEYKNVLLLSNFVNELGHIKPRSLTGLGPQNQIKVAKAIKRARAMGLMPYTYKMISEDDHWKKM